MAEAIAKFEAKYRENLALGAIVAIVVYLILKQ